MVYAKVIVTYPIHDYAPVLPPISFTYEKGNLVGDIRKGLKEQLLQITKNSSNPDVQAIDVERVATFKTTKYNRMYAGTFKTKPLPATYEMTGEEQQLILETRIGNRHELDPSHVFQIDHQESKESVTYLQETTKETTKEKANEAIRIGVPLFNKGNPERCAFVYEQVVLEILKQYPSQYRLSVGKALLEKDDSKRAWEYRHIIDHFLSGL